MSCFGGRMNEYDRISLDRFDGKNLQSTVYFLSHLHEDHTVGLADQLLLKRLKSNKDIFVYCSDVTEILLLASAKYKHLGPYIKSIKINTPTTIPIPDPLYAEVEQVTVTLLPAFHCPGSVMCLIEGNEGTVLYTGDFRWEHFNLEQMHHLRSGESVKKIKSLYVDTTFCMPENLFIPSRQQCIDATYHLVQEWTSKSPEHVVYVFLRAQFGHEPLLNAVASRLNKKIHVNSKKQAIYSRIVEFDGIFTDDGLTTQIHACDKGATVQVDDEFVPCWSNHDPDKVLIILPTTMYFMQYQHLTLDKIVKKVGNKYYRVCYSFHSSYTEIKDLLAYLLPEKVFPNVKPKADTTLAQTQHRLNTMLKECKQKRQELTDLEEMEVKTLGTLKTRKGRATKRQRQKDSQSEADSLDFGTPTKQSRHTTPSPSDQDISLSQGSRSSTRKGRGQNSKFASQPSVGTRRSGRKTARTDDGEEESQNSQKTPKKKRVEDSPSPDLFASPVKGEQSDVSELHSSYMGSQGESEIDLSQFSQKSAQRFEGDEVKEELSSWSLGSFLDAISSSSSMEDNSGCVCLLDDPEQTDRELLDLVADSQQEIQTESKTSGKKTSQTPSRKGKNEQMDVKVDEKKEVVEEAEATKPDEDDKAGIGNTDEVDGVDTDRKTPKRGNRGKRGRGRGRVTPTSARKDTKQEKKHKDDEKDENVTETIDKKSDLQPSPNDEKTREETIFKQSAAEETPKRGRRGKRSSTRKTTVNMTKQVEVEKAKDEQVEKAIQEEKEKAKLEKEKTNQEEKEKAKQEEKEKAKHEEKEKANQEEKEKANQEEKEKAKQEKEKTNQEEKGKAKHEEKKKAKHEEVEQTKQEEKENKRNEKEEGSSTTLDGEVTVALSNKDESCIGDETVKKSEADTKMQLDDSCEAPPEVILLESDDSNNKSDTSFENADAESSEVVEKKESKLVDKANTFSGNKSDDKKDSIHVKTGKAARKSELTDIESVPSCSSNVKHNTPVGVKEVKRLRFTRRGSFDMIDDLEDNSAFEKIKISLAKKDSLEGSKYDWESIGKEYDSFLCDNEDKVNISNDDEKETFESIDDEMLNDQLTDDFLSARKHDADVKDDIGKCTNDQKVKNDSDVIDLTGEDFSTSLIDGNISSSIQEVKKYANVCHEEKGGKTLMRISFSKEKRNDYKKMTDKDKTRDITKSNTKAVKSATDITQEHDKSIKCLDSSHEGNDKTIRADMTEDTHIVSSGDTDPNSVVCVLDSDKTGSNHSEKQDDKETSLDISTDNENHKKEELLNLNKVKDTLTVENESVDKWLSSSKHKNNCEVTVFEEKNVIVVGSQDNETSCVEHFLAADKQSKEDSFIGDQEKGNIEGHKVENDGQEGDNDGQKEDTDMQKEENNDKHKEDTNGQKDAIDGQKKDTDIQEKENDDTHKEDTDGQKDDNDGQKGDNDGQKGDNDGKHKEDTDGQKKDTDIQKGDDDGKHKEDTNGLKGDNDGQKVDNNDQKKEIDLKKEDNDGIQKEDNDGQKGDDDGQMNGINKNDVDENKESKMAVKTDDLDQKDKALDVEKVNTLETRQLSAKELEEKLEVKRQAMGFVCETDSDSDSDESSSPPTPSVKDIYDDYIELSSGVSDTEDNTTEKLNKHKDSDRSEPGSHHSKQRDKDANTSSWLSSRTSANRPESPALSSDDEIVSRSKNSKDHTKRVRNRDGKFYKPRRSRFSSPKVPEKEDCRYLNDDMELDEQDYPKDSNSNTKSQGLFKKANTRNTKRYRKRDDMETDSAILRTSQVHDRNRQRVMVTSALGVGFRGRRKRSYRLDDRRSLRDDPYDSRGKSRSDEYYKSYLHRPIYTEEGRYTSNEPKQLLTHYQHLPLKTPLGANFQTQPTSPFPNINIPPPGFPPPGFPSTSIPPNTGIFPIAQPVASPVNPQTTSTSNMEQLKANIFQITGLTVNTSKAEQVTVSKPTECQEPVTNLQVAKLETAQSILSSGVEKSIGKQENLSVLVTKLKEVTQLLETVSDSKEPTGPEKIEQTVPTSIVDTHKRDSHASGRRDTIEDGRRQYQTNSISEDLHRDERIPPRLRYDDRYEYTNRDAPPPLRPDPYYDRLSRHEDDRYDRDRFRDRYLDHYDRYREDLFERYPTDDPYWDRHPHPTSRYLDRYDYSRDYYDYPHGFPRDFPGDDLRGPKFLGDDPLGPRYYLSDHLQGRRDFASDDFRGPRDHPGEHPRGPRDHPGEHPRGPREYPDEYPRGPREYPDEYPRGPREYPDEYRRGPREYPDEFPRGPLDYYEDKRGSQRQHTMDHSEDPIDHRANFPRATSSRQNDVLPSVPVQQPFVNEQQKYQKREKRYGYDVNRPVIKKPIITTVLSRSRKVMSKSDQRVNTAVTDNKPQQQETQENSGQSEHSHPVFLTGITAKKDVKKPWYPTPVFPTTRRSS